MIITRFIYVNQVHSKDCDHIKVERGSRYPDCCDKCFLLFKTGITTRIKSKMKIFVNFIISLGKKFESPEKTLFDKFIRIADEHMNNDGIYLKQEVRSVLSFMKESQNIGLKSSIYTLPQDILGLRNLNPDQIQTFERPHVMTLATWAIARIQNPREAVPDSLKSIMLMISDMSPKVYLM